MFTMLAWTYAITQAQFGQLSTYITKVPEVYVKSHCINICYSHRGSQN